MPRSHPGHRESCRPGLLGQGSTGSGRTSARRPMQHTRVSMLCSRPGRRQARAWAFSSRPSVPSSRAPTRPRGGPPRPSTWPPPKPWPTTSWPGWRAWAFLAFGPQRTTVTPRPRSGAGYATTRHTCSPTPTCCIIRCCRVTSTGAPSCGRCGTSSSTSATSTAACSAATWRCCCGGCAGLRHATAPPPSSSWRQPRSLTRPTMPGGWWGCRSAQSPTTARPGPP